ncbi:hypothetical protein ACOMHN_046417 [Nucella lapillus]
MADVTTASTTSASVAAPVGIAVKPSTSKPKAVRAKKPSLPAEHPKYRDMITSAINHLKERRGSSRQAILKYILAHYRVGTEIGKINARIKMALRAGIKNSSLRQMKGSGASGSFRLGEKSLAAKPKAVSKKPKAALKKPTVKKVAKKAALKKAGIPKKGLKKTKSANKQKKSSAKLAARKIKAKVGKSPAKKVVKKATKSPKKMVKKSPAKKASKGKVSKK